MPPPLSPLQVASEAPSAGAIWESRHWPSETCRCSLHFWVSHEPRQGQRDKQQYLHGVLQHRLRRCPQGCSCLRGRTSLSPAVTVVLGGARARVRLPQTRSQSLALRGHGGGTARRCTAPESVGFSSGCRCLTQGPRRRPGHGALARSPAPLWPQRGPARPVSPQRRRLRLLSPPRPSGTALLCLHLINSPSHSRLPQKTSLFSSVLLDPRSNTCLPQ